MQQRLGIDQDAGNSGEKIIRTLYPALWIVIIRER
jgi:hypothetical protein